MKHVLVVDADRQLRSVYISALEAAGFTAVGAVSAQAAVGQCESKLPNVIILELQLQGHSGVELLHELRSYPEWQHIPVILQTMVPRKALERFDDAFKTMGIVAYAYKPETSLKKLISLVKDLAV